MMGSWYFDKGRASLAPVSGKALAAGSSIHEYQDLRLAPSGSQEQPVRGRVTVLFIDARQVDRAHCKFSPKQVKQLANIMRLYRGEQPEFMASEDDEVETGTAQEKPTAQSRTQSTAGCIATWLA